MAPNGVIEDEKLRGLNLDLAGRHLRIDRVLIAQANRAHRGDNIFRSNGLALKCPSGVSSLSSTTWAMPERSRTSRKIRLP